MSNLESLLRLCGDTFREYAAHHAAKCTPESQVKADRNTELANSIDQLLAERQSEELDSRAFAMQALAAVAEDHAKNSSDMLVSGIATALRVELEREQTGYANDDKRITLKPDDLLKTYELYKVDSVFNEQGLTVTLTRK